MNLLSQIYDPPKKLYFKGDKSLLDKNCIAIVGTRKNSEYGRYLTEKIVEELSAYNIVIVSGLARGVDTIAHTSALKNNLPTIAVLGSGLENIYPKENKNLAREIADKGLLISEYENDAAPSKYSFPQRNRIISGISIATVVIEAPESSGALITADFALNQGREIFTVPGDIDRENSKGALKLLQKSAAHPICSGHEIMEILSIQPSFNLLFPNSSQPPSSLQPDQQKVLNILTRRGKSIDQIMSKTSIPISELLIVLSILEIHNLIGINNGKYFKKC